MKASLLVVSVTAPVLLVASVLDNRVCGGGSHDDLARNEVTQLVGYVEMARVKGFPCPDTTHDLVDAEVIKKAKTDPWGNPYWFAKCTEAEVEVCSFGKDGLPRTQDDICS